MKSRFLPALLLFSAFLFFAKNLAAQNTSIVITGPTTWCPGQCDTLVAKISGGVSQVPYYFEWSVNGVPTYNDPSSPSFASNFPFCAQNVGTYVITVNALGVNGTFYTAQYTITVLPFLPLDIISSNPAPCNFDSLGNPDIQSGCEKVCPNTTVTYSVTTNNPPSGNPYLNWQVIGASDYTIHPPFFNSVTVNWGGPGLGSVSVFTFNSSNCSGEDAICVTVIQEPVAKFTADPAPSGNTIQICKGQTVYFENQSADADSYEWLFSDDFSVSFETDPEHLFQNAGNYTVRLIARSDCLCADTTTLNVEVLDAVAPTLDCVGTVCPGATVTYTASNACPPYAWSVTSNGTVLSGGTSTTDSIIIQWNAGPEGIVTLAAQACSGNVCPNPASIRVPVISDDAEIRGPEQVCPGAEEVYSIEPYGGTGFVWTLPVGGTITEGQGTNRVTVKWTDFPNANTTYWLSVKYDNCYLGCGGEDSIGVKVLSPFVVNGPVEICAGASGNFSSKLTYNAANIACNWTLFAPNGSAVWNSPAPTATPNVTFSSGAGIYRLLAEPADPTLTCSEQADWAVNAAALPDKPTGILGEKNICPGTTYTYEAAGVLPTNNLRWTVQNGPGAPVVSLGNKINVTWGTANPRWISAAQVSTNGLNCTSDTALLAVQRISIVSIVGTQIVCEDSKANYSILPLENVDIQWKITPPSAGAVASGQGSNAVEIFWTEAGGHVVSLDVCGQAASLPVTVLALPDPMVQHPANLCPGKTSPIQTTAPYAAYSWRDATGIELATTAIVNLGAGSYAVQVQDGSGCRGVKEFTITENPLPNVSLTTADPTGFCNNSQYVTLTALVNADADFTYQWFQDGVPVGGNSPTYTTNQYGNYTVQVTNSSGCTATAGPILLFDYCGGGGGSCGLPGSSIPLCPPGSVDFSISATTTCDSFHFQLIPGPQYMPNSAQWTFGVSGGAVHGTSTDENPGFHFPNAGKYIALLRVTLTDGSSCAVIDSVSVAAAAQFNTLPQCAGEATDFQDVSTFLPGSGVADWNWVFGDPPSGGNNFSNIRNPSHTYNSSVNALVTLTITANNGCISSVSQMIFIPGGVPAPFAPPALQCAGNALEFSANTTPDMARVDWDFGDLASGAANDATGNPTYHSFTAPSNYAVTTTTTNAYGCTATFTQIITIVPNGLSGNISPANPAPICEGKSIALTAPAGAASYLWSDGATTQTFTANEEGSYSVTLTDLNGCTYVPPPVNVEITPSPDALIKALLQNELGQIIGTSYPTLTTCYGEDVHLIAQGNGSYNFVWSGGNGFDDEVFFGNDHNNTLPTGNHTYTVTVTDISSGCTSVTDPFIVTVNPVPNAAPVTASNTCAGDANTLTYTGSAPANWQFVWNTGALGTTLTTDEAGLYFIRVINEFGCEAKSAPIAILPGPNVAAIPGGCHTRCRPDTLCLPLIPNIISWQWYFNGNPISGANSPNFIATQSGSYYAELTDVYGCTNQSDPLTLNLFDGFGNITGQVWSDVNANGVIDASDTLISGVFVNLLQNGNSVGTGQSAANGAFSFANILSDNYVVEIDPAQLPLGWNVVVGQDAVTLTGCNAEGEADLLLRFCPTSSSWLPVVVCAGGFYDFNGVQIAGGQTQSFTFQNAFGCDSVVTVTVSELPISSSQLNVKVCPGTFYDYNGAQVAAGATQDFTFQNQFGCDSTVTVTVGESPTSHMIVDAIACEGEVLYFNGVGIPAGSTHIFNYLNSSGCDSIIEVAVGTYGPIQTSTLQAVVCPGETFQFNGQQLAPGTTTDVTLANVWGCDSIVTVTVTETSVTSEFLEVTICPDEKYSFNGTEIAAGDTVVFHFTTPEGCDSTVTVAVSASPVTTFECTANQTCPNEPSGGVAAVVTAGGLPPYRYSLDGVVFQDSPIFEQLPVGQYTFFIQDSIGCIFENNVQVSAFPPLTVGLPDGVLPCDTSEILLELALGGDLTDLKIKWFNGDTTTFTRVSEVGPVWVEVTNQCETVRREAAVNWEDLAVNGSYAYVPNVFKPSSNDPNNSEFKPYFQPDLRILNYRFEVFDRWGNKMFSTEQPDVGWHGVFRADDMNPGVYVWYVQVKFAFCGREREMQFSGDVTVVR